MPASAPAIITEIGRLCVWLALLALIFLPLERLFAVRRAAIVRAQFWTDLGYYFLSGLAPALLLAAPLAAVAWVARTAVPDPLHAFVAAQPLWLLLPVALVIGDAGAYWGHRLSHEVPWLWRFHAVHHSAEHVDWLVNTRAHPIDLLVTRLFGLTPLYVLGLAGPVGAKGTLVPVLVAVIGTIWSFFIHANVGWRFGRVERALATPFFHHWHHSRRDHVDRNYAAMFPFLDHLFGTLHLPADWPCEYGTDTDVGARLATQLVRPFAARPRDFPAE